MPKLSLVVSALILSLVQGCAMSPLSPKDAEEPKGKTDSVRELATVPSPCEQVCGQASSGLSLLDRGYKALALGDYKRAQRYFQSYRRMNSRHAARWEADVAMTFMMALPGTPFYQPEQARTALQVLDQNRASTVKVQDSSLLLHLMLTLLLEQQQQISDKASEVEGLKNDVAVREAALKRLRELTLGQQAGGR